MAKAIVVWANQHPVLMALAWLVMLAFIVTGFAILVTTTAGVAAGALTVLLLVGLIAGVRKATRQ